MSKKDVIKELQAKFSDLLNYESDDPLEPINPLIYRTPEGDSCLHLAAIRGDYQAAQLLIEAGVDVNQIGDMGNTPLHYAYRHGHADVVRLLIENGASKNIGNEFGDMPGESKDQSS